MKNSFLSASRLVLGLFLSINLLISSSSVGMTTASTAVVEKPKIEEIAKSTPTQQVVPEKVGGKTEAREEKCAFKKPCVNVMWISRYDRSGPWSRSECVYDEEEVFTPKEETLQKKFLDPIYKWASACKKAVTVNVWYDSSLTSWDAIANTRKLFAEYAEKHPDSAPIKLRDVRELPLVKKHPKIFSSDIPVYFRVDLLRAIIACYLLQTGETDCFIYSDLDIKKVLSIKELFDQETVENLQEFGIVLSRGGVLGFENGFQMITNNKNLLKAMEWALIEVNIQRAYNALKGEYCQYYRSYDAVEKSLKAIPQIIYDSYPPMFRYFYHLEKRGVLGVKRYVTDKDNRVLKKYSEPYDKEKDGLQPFNLISKDMDAFVDFSYTKDFEETLWLRKDHASWHLYVPTKQVDLPPASLNYQ